MIYLNDVPVNNITWFTTEITSTSQKGFKCIIPIGHLAMGFHNIRVDKVIWDTDLKKDENKFKLIEGWDEIRFYKIKKD